MRSRMLDMKFGYFIVMCMVTALFPWFGTNQAHANANGTTYYIDSVNGNDSNSGTTTTTPWKSLSKVNGTVFQPGDSILFKAGSSWTGHLKPQGSGSAGNPIVIGMYGTGNKPLIQGAGAPSTVSLYNQEYWEIGHLEITNKGPTATSFRRGVSIIGEDYQVGSTNDLSVISTLRHIRLHDLYIHDVNGQDMKDGNGSAGIQISVQIPGLDGTSNPAPGSVHRRTTFDHVVIENNMIDTVSRSGIITWSDWKNRAALGDNIGYGNSALTPWTPLTNVVIRGNKLSNIGGDGIVPHMTESTLVEHNVVNGFNKTSSGYNVGMWTWNGDHTLYQYNEVSGGFSTRDGNAFDFDHASDGIIYQYNYSHDNDGGTLLICADGNGGSVTNGIFRYNISQNDKYQTFTICAGSNVYNTQIYNNIFYVGSGSTKPLVNQGGAVEVTLRNNIFYNMGTGGYAKKSSWTYDHNLFFGNNVPSQSVIPDSNMMTSDPLFINPGSGTSINELNGYKLRSGSPAIGSGTLISDNGGKDFWGNLISAISQNRGAYGSTGDSSTVPTNLIKNNGFELGSSSWALWNASIVAGHAQTGTNAGKLTGGLGSFEQTVTGLSPNTTYTLTVSAKTDSQDVKLGVKNYGGAEKHVSITTSDYSQGTLTFTTGATNTSAIIYLYKSTTGNTAYGDTFSLVKN